MKKILMSASLSTLTSTAPQLLKTCPRIVAAVLQTIGSKDYSFLEKSQNKNFSSNYRIFPSIIINFIINIEFYSIKTNLRRN